MTDRRLALTRGIVRLVLAAAVVTAPAFLFAEGFSLEHVWRVLASNGSCAALCLLLLAWLRKGETVRVARVLVFGLLALVTSLAWGNGEPVQVNVVNFVLVTVLCAVLLSRGALVFVGSFAAAAMVAIAWKSPLVRGSEELSEARFESIVQFLPTYTVVVIVLWMWSGATERDRP